MVVAPIVMAYLAKQVSTRGMDAGALGGMLGQQRAEVDGVGGDEGDALGATDPAAGQEDGDADG